MLTTESLKRAMQELRAAPQVTPVLLMIRHPRSKKRRIWKKWQRDPRNFQIGWVDENGVAHLNMPPGTVWSGQ